MGATQPSDDTNLSIFRVHLFCKLKQSLRFLIKIATVRSTGPFDLAPILRNERTGISVLNARPLLNNVSVLDIKYLASLLGQSNVVLVSHTRPSFNLQ